MKDYFVQGDLYYTICDKYTYIFYVDRANNFYSPEPHNEQSDEQNDNPTDNDYFNLENSDAFNDDQIDQNSMDCSSVSLDDSTDWMMEVDDEPILRGYSYRRGNR